MDKGLRDMAVRSFFFSGQAPEARPAQCPMLTCNGRSCKCTSPAVAGYRPVKVYLVLSLGCNGEREGATAKARAQRRARGCDGEGEGATARQPCILYSISGLQQLLAVHRTENLHVRKRLVNGVT